MKKWQVTPGRTLHFHHWNDEVAVFDALSGNTHLLDAPTAEILLSLQKTAADTETVAQSTARALQEDPHSLRPQIESILDELYGLGLIDAITA